MRDARETFAAHGIEPSDEELVAYSLLGQMLRAMVEQLYAIDPDDER